MRTKTHDQLGLTLEQHSMLRKTGKAMRAAGRPSSSTPLRAFNAQKKGAAIRGIGWELTVWEWWTIWLESGRWHARGRGAGYMMCRKGDLGPYAVGNVFIASGIENVSTGPTRKGNLPLGVGHTAKRFIAKRCFNGKRHYLGSFPTPELAHAAYLRATPESLTQMPRVPSC